MTINQLFRVDQIKQRQFLLLEELCSIDINWDKIEREKLGRIHSIIDEMKELKAERERLEK